MLCLQVNHGSLLGFARAFGYYNRCIEKLLRLAYKSAETKEANGEQMCSYNALRSNWDHLLDKRVTTGCEKKFAYMQREHQLVVIRKACSEWTFVEEILFV